MHIVGIIIIVLIIIIIMIIIIYWCWANGMIPTEWRRNVIVPIPKKGKGCVQDGRVSRNMLSTSSIQSGVWHYPREVDTGGWREKFGGRRARGV